MGGVTAQNLVQTWIHQETPPPSPPPLLTASGKHYPPPPTPVPPPPKPPPTLTRARNIGHADVFFATTSAGCAVNTNTTACRSSRVHVKRPGCAAKTNTNGLSLFARLRPTSRMCCKNQYKRHACARNIGHTDVFRHFECRMCCKTNTKTNTTACRSSRAHVNGMSVFARLRQRRSQQQQQRQQFLLNAERAGSAHCGRVKLK